MGDDCRLVRTVPDATQPSIPLMVTDSHYRSVYSGAVSGPICAHCSCPLSLRSSSSGAFTCPQCSGPTSTYCNRLCYSRAQAYHPFLCEGQNPACVPLLKTLKMNEWAAPHALARVTGRLLGGWRDAQVGGGGAEGWEGDWKFFRAMAGWSLEDKYRSEG